MADTYSIAEAQANLPKLCRSKRPFLIRRREKLVFVALPLEDWEALLETMELLANPKACKTLLDAKAGKGTYTKLDLNDENLGV